MTDPKASISMENVAGSTGIDQELDLRTLAEDLDGVSYDPDVFPGLVYRLQNPNASCLMFRSGQIVCTGASSIGDLEQAVALTFDTLRELGLKVPAIPDLTIQNIVTSGDLGQSLNLHTIAIGIGLENVEYEPEQFPGLVYRLQEPEVVALLFASGKVVITGATHPKQAEHAIEAIQSRLSGLGLV